MAIYKRLKIAWLHLKIITKHKFYVMIECFKLGLYWQGLVHDLSKYSFAEFWNSAKYFQGTGTPVAAEKDAIGYSVSWLHHKGRNPHHWEYWTDFRNGPIYAIPIPKKYIQEMFCDMIGASKAYLKGTFNRKEPLVYFLRESPKWTICPESLDYLHKMLEDYANAEN
jgi:hypothetical protein